MDQTNTLKNRDSLSHKDFVETVHACHAHALVVRKFDLAEENRTTTPVPCINDMYIPLWLRLA